MKKLYNRFLRFVEKIPLKIETFKTFIAEWVAIFRKAPLYRNIKWTKAQQKEFDEFWIKNYGKKISNRWHRLYEAASGVYRVDYFPEILFSTKIEPKINNFTYRSVYADKNLNELFFNNRLEGVRTPDCFMANIHGRFFDSDRHLISKDKAIQILRNIGEAVIKPTVDSSSGKNVAIINMQNGVNSRNGLSADQILNSYKSNFIVQEKIAACEELKMLYPNAINTFRVMSYIVGDSIEVASISLRIGGGGGEVDNVHAGGLSIAVDNEGRLAKKAVRLGYGDSFESFEKHPDTGVVFDGYKFIFIDKLISAAKRLHEMTANIGVISWDFTVDKEGNIVIVEANFKAQGVWLSQMLSGESLFGRNTRTVLKEMLDK